jgi:hypothetical protein
MLVIIVSFSAMIMLHSKLLVGASLRKAGCNPNHAYLGSVALALTKIA